MFDPERDWDPGVRPFYLRLVAVALVTGTACAALWPSVTGFSVGPDHNTECVAVARGWHFEVGAPTAADIAAAQAAFGPRPTPAQVSDPQFMAAWRTRWRAAQANPATIRANARQTWLDGPGACVPESRHRLILSAAGLGCLFLATLGLRRVFQARTASRLRAIGAVG